MAEAEEAPDTKIGTVDIPERTERERYFRELTYLELSALFAGPLKPSALAKWAEIAPKGSLGLVAPWVLTHRKPPVSTKLWTHDGSVGDFRDSGPGRVALAEFRAAVELLGAAYAIFKSPPLFAPSAANRDTLAKFFGEIATEEACGAPRVWIPDGLWETRSAVAFATEHGVICAFDPLIVDPNTPHEIYFDLDVTQLYLRIESFGRAGTMRAEQLEQLAILLEQYGETFATIAFASPARWQDAKNLKKLLTEG